MNELITTIKFVAGQSGGTADSVSTSSATGDFGFMIAAAIIMLIGACVVGSILYQHKKVMAGSHVNNLSHNSTNKFAILVIAAITCLLAFSLAAIGSTHANALADDKAPLSGNEIVGTVDPDTGAVTFSYLDIKNTSEVPQEIQEFALDAAEGITTIDNVVWTINIGETKVFDGKVGDSQAFSDAFTIDAGASAKMTVSVKDMSADFAKSLIDKDVAVATTTYDVASYDVMATVDDKIHGTVDPETISVKYGTTYTADVENSTITFVYGEDEDEIVFEPAQGWKLDKWLVGEKEATTGTITDSVEFEATTVTEIYYSGCVLHPNEDGTENAGLDGATVEFMNGQTKVDSTTTSDGGKYTFTKASVGTEGTIVVTKPASTSDADDYGYSSDAITVDKTTQTQATAHVGKIKSLAVKVFQYDSTVATADLRSTYWCPAFADNSILQSDIKFFKDDKSLISYASGATGYKMSDLCNVEYEGQTIKSATMIAEYFAICTAGHTLNCYQTTDATFNDAFGGTSVVPAGETATKFLSSFNKAKNSSQVEVSRIEMNGQEITPHGVYWDTKDKQNWAATTSWSSTPFPTVNGVNYYKNSQSVNGWYETYGGFAGGVLSCCSFCPWSAVASSGNDAFYWDTNDSKWLDNDRGNFIGVVLSQAFVS